MKRIHPITFKPTPPSEPVLELDDVGRAAAARHIVEGQHGHRLMYLVPTLDEFANRRQPRRAESSKA